MDNPAHNQTYNADLWSYSNNAHHMSHTNLQNYLSNSREHQNAPDVARSSIPSSHPYMLLNYPHDIAYNQHDSYHHPGPYDRVEPWHTKKPTLTPCFPFSKHLPVKSFKSKTLEYPTKATLKENVVDQPLQQNHLSGLSQYDDQPVDRDMNKGDGNAQRQISHCHQGLNSNTSSHISLAGTSEPKRRNTNKKQKKEKPKKKERVRNEDSWARNRRKRAREKGEGYVNVVGKFVPARSVKAVDCSKCKFQCTSHISDEERKELFESYWGLKTFRERVDFICSFVEEFVPLRPVSGRRSFSRRYKVQVKGKETRVCKEFFTTTFDVSESTIVTALNKKRQNPLIIEDLRGKRPPSNKTPETVLQNIREHILSEIGLQRNLNTIPDSKAISVQKLYSLYEEECLQDDMKPASLYTYRRVFADLHRGQSDKPISLPPNDAFLQELKVTSKQQNLNTHTSASENTSPSAAIVSSTPRSSSSSATAAAATATSAACISCEPSLSPNWDSSLGSISPQTSDNVHTSNTDTITNFADSCMAARTPQLKDSGFATSKTAVSSNQVNSICNKNCSHFNSLQELPSQHQRLDSFHPPSSCLSVPMPPALHPPKDNSGLPQVNHSSATVSSLSHLPETISDPLLDNSKGIFHDASSACRSHPIKAELPKKMISYSACSTTNMLHDVPHGKVSASNSNYNAITASAGHPTQSSQFSHSLTVPELPNNQSSVQEQNNTFRRKKPSWAVTKETFQQGTKGKKRTRNEESWVRNVRKRLRFKGEEYISVRGKTVEAKKVKDVDCSKCKFKCPVKMTQEQRQEINTYYWNLESYIDKIVFITKRVKTFKPKRKLTGKRAFSRKYTFEIDRKEVQVCKDFFIGTLNLGESAISTALEKSRKGPEALVDLRGKHKAANKTPDNTLQNICDLIVYVTGLRRHRYCENAKKEFGYRVNQLYQIYQYDSKVKGNRVASLHVFRSILQKEFGIAGSTNTKSKKSTTKPKAN